MYLYILEVLKLSFRPGRLRASCTQYLRAKGLGGAVLEEDLRGEEAALAGLPLGRRQHRRDLGKNRRSRPLKH